LKGDYLVKKQEAIYYSSIFPLQPAHSISNF